MDPADNNHEPALHVWMVLWKAAHSVRENALRQIASMDLGLTDFTVLELLLHKGPLPVNVIGTKVFLTSGSVTTAVDRLESRDLVVRGVDSADRRTRIVHLTEKGRKTIECAFEAHRREMEEVFAPLSDAERRELVTLLKKLGLHAQQFLERKKG